MESLIRFGRSVHSNRLEPSSKPDSMIHLLIVFPDIVHDTHWYYLFIYFLIGFNNKGVCCNYMCTDSVFMHS